MNSYVLSAIILSALITYKWKKNTFLSIILSTLVYMIFIRL